MPRQDVPYGGAICRLKERIAEIWDRLDEKLHSINGVGGDGAGNVEIVSGDAAITVSESPTGHFIEIGLDHGNLPSAAVSSVNGQTGAVRLDAADIPSDGNSNVQADIAANKAAINECFDAITSEQAARQNADAALQGNINSVQASIPGAAAAAVANDPTVAQLAADVPGKLDKISSGNSLKAYTHTGQSQGETSIVNGTDANSIGLRDANGRMQAADPAAGATDKTLVTANWVSQTGDGAPNNLIHKIGNETKIGNFTATTLTANKTLRYTSSIIIKDSYLPSNTSLPPNTSDASIAVIAKDNSEIMNFIVRTQADGTRIIRIGLHDTATGANHLFNLITISPSGTVSYPWS